MRPWLITLLGATLLATACATSSPAPTAVPTSVAKSISPTVAPTQAGAPAATSVPALAVTSVPPAQAAATAKPESGAPALPVVSGYPSKPIKMICPWDAGGGPDIGARILAAQMEKEIGQSVQVVNMAGASTQIGMEALVNSKPDGYTILYTTIPSSVAVYLDPQRKASFSFKDFVVGPQTALDPMSVSVLANSKYKTLADLVADLKVSPGQIKAGDTGFLAVNHLAILQLEQLAKSTFANVHFTGGAPLLTALEGGHVDVAFNSTSSMRPGIQGGQARMLAVSVQNRSKYYPDVPTYKELGFNVLAAAFHGVIWPKGTPAEIGKYLEAAVLRSTYNADFQDKMDKAGLEMVRAGSDDFAKTWQDQEKLYLDLSKLATP